MNSVNFLPLPPYLDYRDAKAAEGYESRSAVDRALAYYDKLREIRRLYRDGRESIAMELRKELDAAHNQRREVDLSELLDSQS